MSKGKIFLAILIVAIVIVAIYLAITRKSTVHDLHGAPTINDATQPGPVPDFRKFIPGQDIYSTSQREVWVYVPGDADVGNVTGAHHASFYPGMSVSENGYVPKGNVIGTFDKIINLNSMIKSGGLTMDIPVKPESSIILQLKSPNGGEHIFAIVASKDLYTK